MKLLSLISCAALLFAVGAYAQDSESPAEAEKAPTAEKSTDKDDTGALPGPFKPSRKDAGEVGARYPTFSPDGSEVAFSMAGDIWVMPSTGGVATRLTRHEANDISPRWSPDGKYLAFTSDRTGSYDVHVMSSDGGRPRRLTFDGATDHVNYFSNDGEQVIFQSTRSGTWGLYSVPTGGGEPVSLTVDERAGYASPNHDESDWLYYTYMSSDSKVKGYRGSANDELYRCLPGQIPEVLTHNNQSERNPLISKDGQTLFFTRETGADGKDYNLFSMNLQTREETQHTNLDSNGMSYLRFNADQSKLAFIWDFRIYSIDMSNPGAKPTLLKIEVVEDSTLPDMIEITSTSGAQNFDLSYDGRQIALQVGGALWLMGSEGGNARRLSTPGRGDNMPRFSPDGRMIAFYSEGRGPNADIYVVGTNGQGLRNLTQNGQHDRFMNWSPDGKYLVYASDIGTQGDREVFRVMLDGSKPVQLTNAPGNKVSDDPSVSPDGNFIAFDSDRAGNDRDIYIMNSDGTGLRRIGGANGAHDESPRFSPDGQYVVYNRTATGIRGSRQVILASVSGNGEIVVGSGNSGVFSPDGKEIYYLDPRGRIQAVPTPSLASTGRTVPFFATTEIEESEQFLTAFNEAWTHVNNNFYDKKFHGVDWNAMKKKYEPLVRQARTKMEFHFYVLNMIGELNASHQNINGNTSVVPGYNTGRLGADWSPEIMDTKVKNRRGKETKKHHMRLKLTKVDKGGPADDAWLREGDYVFGVNGKRFNEDTRVSQHLNNGAGQTLKLMVSDDPTGEKVRTIEVKLESDGQRRSRNYRQWLRECADTTKEEGKGKVAYIHIPQMNQGALAAFRRDLMRGSTQKAEALVLDVRNNGGGNIHEQLFTIFSLNKYATMFSKNSNPKNERPAPTVYWGRPVVVLINTRSYSDAEVFPHGMKTLGLAKIVGEPTPGAVIGTVNLPLSDGSTFRVTRTGFRNLDGTNQEHNGCQPDYLVQHTPEDRVNKNDRQLKKAIEVALGMIENDPTEVPQASSDDTAATASAESNEEDNEEPELPEEQEDSAEPAALPYDPLEQPFLG